VGRRLAAVVVGLSLAACAGTGTNSGEDQARRAGGLPDPRGAAEDAATAQVIGETTTHVIARRDATLIDLAVDANLGYLQLVAANPGVDPWLPGLGTPVVVPTARIVPDVPRRGIVVNLPERRLYYFEAGRLVADFPVGIGRDGLETPRGSSRVVGKRANPTWYPTAAARRDDPSLPAAVPPGPDNPLGSRALDLGWSEILIHGTNRPYAIGRRASRGCIRLYPADIERLFERVRVGTPAMIVDQPIKTGWRDGQLFLEAHPTLRQGAQLEDRGRFKPVAVADLRSFIGTRLGPVSPKLVDWAAVERIVRERRGVPIAITPPAAARRLTADGAASKAAAVPADIARPPRPVPRPAAGTISAERGGP
jgi:L,D-transpeptidase ErfK/SrfK